MSGVLAKYIDGVKKLRELSDRASDERAPLGTSVAAKLIGDECARLAALFFALADAELPNDTPRPVLWPKRCTSCSAVLTETLWRGLELRGWVGAFKAHGEVYACELRDCACGSTLGIEVRVSRAEVTL